MPTTNPLARTLSIFGPAGTMRARILLCLVLAVVPLTALSLYLAVDERREEDARARLEEQSIVGVVRTDLDRLFQLSRNLVASMSREKTDAEMCGYLGLLRQSFPNSSTSEYSIFTAMASAAPSFAARSGRQRIPFICLRKKRAWWRAFTARGKSW